MAQDGTGTRTVVVTGASTGIGEACALRLDKAGWRVFAGVRKDADGQRLKSQASDRLTPITLDVTDQAQIDAAAKTVADAVGAAGLQGVVNNAGVSVNGPLEYLTSDDLRKQLEVNVIGQIAVTRTFLELIRQGQGAHRLHRLHRGQVRHAVPRPVLRLEARDGGAQRQPAPGAAAVGHPRRARRAGLHRDEDLGEGSCRTPTSTRRTCPRKRSCATARRSTPCAKPPRSSRRPASRPTASPSSVEHALTSGRPRTRYIVGFDATVQRLLAALVPDRPLDRLVAMQLKLPNKP